jgi:glutathione-regulated potassium-efflux system ancillary protein KefF
MPQNMNQQRVLVLYAHGAPHLSRVNRRMAEAARTVDGVILHDLYETYPDFYIDVAREQAQVAQAGTLVFLHPIQWYGMPALMKEWVDLVLPNGWENGPDGSALKGKRYWLVASTGSAAGDYAAGARHGRPFGDYLAPFEQTAAVCGMRWIAPLILHAAHAVDAGAVDAHVAGFVARLRQLAGSAANAIELEHDKAPGDGA